MPARRRSGLGGWLAALLLAAPVLVGVAYSALAAVGVVGAGAAGRPSAEPVLRVLTDPAVLEGTLWTLWVAAASTLLAGAGAVGVAVAFRGGGRASAFARGIALLPLPVPHLAAALAGLLVLGQSGLLARIAWRLGWIEGPAGMPALVADPLGVGFIVTLAWKELPFLALVAVSVLATRGRALEETASRLGAAPRDVFLRVTWPVLWRGMLPATVAVFTFVAGSYEVAFLLAPSDPLALPLLTWERYTDASLARRADGYVLALVGFALAGIAVAAHEWTRARVPGVGGGAV